MKKNVSHQAGNIVNDGRTIATKLFSGINRGLVNSRVSKARVDASNQSVTLCKGSGSGRGDARRDT